MKKYIVSILSMLIVSVSFAEIQLPKIFADNMVLQRAKPLKFWGKASPNAKVEVEFSSIRKSTIADANGDWNVLFAPLNTLATPQKMDFYENGNLSKTINNILVGEVWVLGGQSNMSWPLLPTIGGKQAVKRASKYSNIRCFKNSKNCLPEEIKNLKLGYFEMLSLCQSEMADAPQKDYSQDWKWETSADAKNAELWSAIGFYFAEGLREKLDVPVGIIMVSLGGSPMVAWIPEKNMGKNKLLKTKWNVFKKQRDKWVKEGGYEKAVAQYQQQVLGNPRVRAGKRIAGGWRVYLPPSKLTHIGHSSTPCYNFNAKVAPLNGLSVAGILWYQGESDCGVKKPEDFKCQLLAVIESWRELFGNVPFIQAQLSSYGKGKNWASVRDVQLRTAIEQAGVFCVNTIDVGAEKDVHPRDKKTVADRMVRTAFAEIYNGDRTGAFSPSMKSVEYNGDVAKVYFDHYDGVIEMRGEPRGFKVRVNGKWQKANASIKNNILEIRSLDGSKIEGVSYLWEQCPMDKVCLFTKDSLPVFPFFHMKGNGERLQ